MNNFELLSLGIYKKSGEISVEKNFIKQLYKDADAHPRNRSRILIHKDSESIPQEMLIAFTSKSIVEVSTHTFPESFTVLDGVAKYIFYEESGELIGDILLSPYENEGTFYCFIPKSTFHRFIPYTENSLAHEVGFSNFDKEFTTLYLDKQFKDISRKTNKEYSIVPRKIINNKLNFKEKEFNEYTQIEISGGIISISHENVQEFMSIKKPVLLKIKDQIPAFINENILIIQTNKEFIIDTEINLQTISLITGSITLILSNNQSINLKKGNSIFYTCANEIKICKIINSNNQLAIVKFTSHTK
ncbi:conserved hypothetical [Prochlorococcus marinus subsp. pastoris str. CCMP1986]|uniref:Conserved hypothetical n=1 Tax=Prochlorococcus marinus subsp. pastoris (strain CCMP1986 / NIES-2087 / MED4) TaxID=59919 RepID=Q7V0M5_PROMP|nr:WbuC family cupin fold metalloprotein [Prochlorococcus marinus]KGF87206.1 hypothetical protein PROCH_0793 [Prochlorococcus marinus str. EQPAC1]CAE19690.1 conserved hypothetical [Prochlorococcus marinus subsp. pastoris str. CCMP1986]